MPSPSRASIVVELVPVDAHEVTVSCRTPTTCKATLDPPRASRHALRRAASSLRLGPQLIAGHESSNKSTPGGEGGIGQQFEQAPAACETRCGPGPRHSWRWSSAASLRTAGYTPRSARTGANDPCVRRPELHHASHLPRRHAWRALRGPRYAPTHAVSYEHDRIAAIPFPPDAFFPPSSRASSPMLPAPVVRVQSARRSPLSAATA